MEWRRGLPVWQIARVLVIGLGLSSIDRPIAHAEEVFSDRPTASADEVFTDDPPPVPITSPSTSATTIISDRDPIWPDGAPFAPEDVSSRGWSGVPQAPIDDFVSAPECAAEPSGPARYYLPVMGALSLRHSTTYGRNAGRGWPLVGTSWLNRPYYFGGELGTLWMTRGVDDSVGRDTDMFGGFFFGWDWDYYWGSEFRFDWATPELINTEALDADRTDSLFVWNYSQMYYPWGDSAIRPYWRWGIGTTSIDFPLDDDHGGDRTDDTLLTFPIGIGVKYPIQRWLAARAEFTDQLAIGSGRIPTQHNLTLTFGLEWRFGVHPKSYWPWHPSRHIL